MFLQFFDTVDYFAAGSWAKYAVSMSVCLPIH